MRYQYRLSGPVLDRFDVRLAVHRPQATDLVDDVAGSRSFVERALREAFGVLAFAGGDGLAGVGLSGKTHNSSVHDNTLQYNSTRYISPTHTGGGKTRDIQIGDSTYSITQSNNKLSPQ